MHVDVEFADVVVIAVVVVIVIMEVELLVDELGAATDIAVEEFVEEEFVVAVEYGSVVDEDEFEELMEVDVVTGVVVVAVVHDDDIVEEEAVQDVVALVEELFAAARALPMVDVRFQSWPVAVKWM